MKTGGKVLFSLGKIGRSFLVGSSSVKSCSLKKVGSGYSLVDFAQVSIPDDAINNRDISNSVGIAQAAIQLVESRKLKKKDVCTGLCGPSILIKSMTVEVENEREVEAQVFFEAENYLPFDPAEVTMDCQVLSRGKELKTEVMFVAAKTSFMESYTNLLEEVGVRPKIVDTEFFALSNVIEANYPQSEAEAIAAFDLGALSMKCVVVSAGVPIYTKEINYGGKNLTADISKNLGHRIDEAERLKLEAGSSPTPQDVMELLQLASENFCIEMKRALDFYQSSTSGAPITQVLLTGGSSLIPNLSAMVEERLGLPTSFLNPFLKVAASEKQFSAESLKEMAPFIAVPMGLAMRACHP